MVATADDKSDSPDRWLQSNTVELMLCTKNRRATPARVRFEDWFVTIFRVELFWLVAGTSMCFDWKVRCKWLDGCVACVF